MLKYIFSLLEAWNDNDKKICKKHLSEQYSYNICARIWQNLGFHQQGLIIDFKHLVGETLFLIGKRRSLANPGCWQNLIFLFKVFSGLHAVSLRLRSSFFSTKHIVQESYQLLKALVKQYHASDSANIVQQFSNTVFSNRIK